MERDDLIAVAVGGITLAIVAFILFTGGEAEANPEFTQCLMEANATMYGYDACSHCRRQKAMLGTEAFAKYLDANGYYVRCRPRDTASQPLGASADRISSVTPVNSSTTQLQACQMNVQGGTPTWVIDGRQYAGVQDIDTLARATGCEV